MFPRAPQSKALLTVVQKLYPIHLADKSWDNTGLLVDSSSDEGADLLNILLTIDLTQAVANEAIKKKSNFVIAYHPFIFRGLKSITKHDPQQKSLLKLIKSNISVYSPHTAVDSVKGGVNDFLADGVVGALGEKSRAVIQPDEKEQGCGMGRLVTLAQPAKIEEIVKNIKTSLGLKYVQVGEAKGETAPSNVETIAICAGSGGSVFKNVQADVYYTGELSHHEALYFTESGSFVVACNHSNTERAYLSLMKQRLQAELPDADILISECDQDPYQTW